MDELSECYSVDQSVANIRDSVLSSDAEKCNNQSQQPWT